MKKGFIIWAIGLVLSFTFVIPIIGFITGMIGILMCVWGSILIIMGLIGYARTGKSDIGSGPSGGGTI